MLRPHGHILRTGDRLVPDEASLTSTAWMDGVFHSLVTQGHVNINRLLSTTRSYLGLLRAGGLRIFVELDDGWQLLDVPSAFEMTPGGCRWIYRYAGGVIEVESRAGDAPPRARRSRSTVLDGRAAPLPARRTTWRSAATTAPSRCPCASSATHDGDRRADRSRHRRRARAFPSGCFRIDPGAGTAIERVAGDELLFADGRSRRQPFLVIVTAPTTAARFRITGGLDRRRRRPAIAARPTTSAPPRPRSGPTSAAASRVHAPAGAPPRSRACRTSCPGSRTTRSSTTSRRAASSSTRAAAGARATSARARSSCCSRSAARSRCATSCCASSRPRTPTATGRSGSRSSSATAASAPATRTATSSSGRCSRSRSTCSRPTTATCSTPRCRSSIPTATPPPRPRRSRRTSSARSPSSSGRQIPGTSLVAYGHGDWNDSLQPADPAMRERLCSSWTVTLQVQTARDARGGAPRARARARSRAGSRRSRAAHRATTSSACSSPTARSPASRTSTSDGRVEYLLHPSDRATGIHYRLLPMIHAIINDMLTPEQARDPRRSHPRRISSRPTARASSTGRRTYRGGAQRFFQRAESSTFFGREIGLMYMHAHLRYAEAMATLRRRRGVLSGAPPGDPDRPPRRRAERAAPPGELLRVELRRRLRRSLRGAGALRRRADRRGRRSTAAGASTRAARASRSV